MAEQFIAVGSYASGSLLDDCVVAVDVKRGGQGRRVKFVEQHALPPAPSLVAPSLVGLGTTESECAEDTGVKDGCPCASKGVLGAIMDFVRDIEKSRPDLVEKAQEASAELPPTLPTAPSAEAEAVRNAAALLNCDSESCVLTNPNFVVYAEQKLEIPREELVFEKETRFKAAGPRDSTELLSNFNIDRPFGVLIHWARSFTDFFPYPFAMMDFDKTGEAFSTIRIADVLEGRQPLNLGPGAGEVRRRNTTLACVLNTDVSTGAGLHWVAVFVDCRSPPWSIEYFNSAGRPPPKPMIAWMERTRAELLRYRKGTEINTMAVTDVSHQKSQTECGLYSLFYIRRRLEGTPVSFFTNPRFVITDDDMTKFRAHCFRATE